MRGVPLYSLIYLLGVPAGSLRVHSPQEQNIVNIYGDNNDKDLDTVRYKRDTTENTITESEGENSNITSVFDLQDSHLHLMVHWAGQKSSIVFCLARDQEINLNSTSRFFISTDYGTSFLDVSNRFVLKNGENATINKFFHHPNNHCYYVFTDVVHRRIFVTQDCGETVTSIDTDFVPKHVEFDVKVEPRFLVHDRESANMTLFVTVNYGNSFQKVGEFVKNFFIYNTEAGSVLYVTRLEPSGSQTILSSTDFFKDPRNTKVVIRDVEEFELKQDFLFAVKSDPRNAEEKLLYVGRHDQRMSVAQFPENNLSFLSYYVADVSEDGSIMLISSHNTTHSNLYVSDIVSEHEVQFTLSLERIMFYTPRTTWRNSWIDRLMESTPDSEAIFADFYKISGLRGVYLASQLDVGVTEDNIRPSNLSTLISFDAGGYWSPIVGPTTDHQGHPIQGCYQDTNCSLHIAQELSRKYPATRSIPILTTQAAPGVVLATGNMGRNLQTKTSVYMSADAGLSWHQVLQGNYYYNIGDHGGVLVAVKYFKTEGFTNEIMYSTDEGLNWKSHQFYPTPMRIFGLITEPGENTTIFTMFGTKFQPGKPIDWIIIKVDLSSVFKRNCTVQDYKDWSPKPPESYSEDGLMSKCVLGRRDVYRRRSPKADCFNGEDYTRAKRMEVCECTHLDYRCDFGYIRDSGKLSGCIKDPEFNIHPPGIPSPCPQNTFYNISKGYVKVTGNVCEGGQSSRYEPEVRACPFDINGHETYMLVAQRTKIVKVSLKENNSTVETLPLVGIQNVIAMDMDYASECVIWADMNTDVINKQCLTNSSQVEELVGSGLSSVEGMAFDQISKILYFVDGFKKTIELVKTDGLPTGHRMRKIILTRAQLGHTSKPRGIALHPKQGYMFYTDWAEKAACVGRALLDGSNHSIIINSVNQRGMIQVKWPNGITVDTVSERVYWVDAALDFIASSNLDGNDFKKVVFNQLEVAHPFAVSVLKDEVYWDDWTRKSIYSANKDRGTNIRLIQTDFPGAMDLKVYSPHLLTEQNSCSSHSCSHLCISLPPGLEHKYKCLCPDGMKANGTGTGTVCICPDNQELLPNGTCSAAKVGGSCDTELQFQCNNNLCIPNLWKCDGSNDCGDMSDENDCFKDQCPGNKFQCENKKCIPAHWRCDNEKDCADESDELNCPRTDCDHATQFKCANGQCINKKWVCDLEKDCYDGSDELNCTQEGTKCKDDQMQCEIGGSCLPSAWRCDGDEDCPGGTDEHNCTIDEACQDWQFRCDNHHCIFSTWRCDGQPDCVDGSDEKDCNITADPQLPPPQPNFPQGNCNDWMFKCGSGQCIPFWWKCDGVEDCSDGTDEENCGEDSINPNLTPGNRTGDEPAVVGCPTNKFQCYNGNCIWSAWLCDGDQDCTQGEDEDKEMCKDKVRCIPGQFLCKLTGGCVSLTAVCDGKQDCDDGSDEQQCRELPTSDDDEIHVGCGVDEFSCDRGSVCLPWKHKCDGHFDCRDGSDEELCEHWGEDIAIAMLEPVDEDGTDHSVRVRWWPKSDLVGNATMFVYKLSYTIQGLSSWRNLTEDWVSREDWEDTVDNLLPGTEYQIRLFVKNSQTGREYHHAPVCSTQTLDGVPTPPRDLSIEQKGSGVQLSWKPPADPQGTITHYKVTVSHNGNMYTSADIEVKDPLQPGSAGFGGLESGSQFTFQVYAMNKVALSSASEPLEFTLHQEIETITILQVTESMIRLNWSSLPEISEYYIKFQTVNQLDQGTNVNSTQTKISLVGLAPGTKYTVYISGITEHGLTLPKLVEVKTEGLPLPAPTILEDGTALLPDSPTSVKLVWSIPSPSAKVYTYAVWYGASLRELVEGGPRLTFIESHGTVADLDACTDYIFAVAILSANHSAGIGPMSNKKTVRTEYSMTAVPKNVGVEGNLVTWESPCSSLENEVGYTITILDTTTGKSSFTSLAGTRNSTISHYVNNLIPGATYSVTISQNNKNAKKTVPVLMYGPVIPPPTAVYADFANRSLTVHWGKEGAARNDDQFTVLLSPSEDLSKGCHSSPCTLCFPTVKSPFTIHRSEIMIEFSKDPHCKITECQVAVATVKSVNQYEYMSAWVRASRLLVDISEEHQGEIVIEESSAVGTVIGVLFVIAILVSALGYFMFKHRRLRRTIQEYAASHYSSATGHATLLDEDDESPIIRGFSDVEPLVVA